MPTRPSQHGMVLIGMIVVLFLVSALVVAMMSQSTSSLFSSVRESSSKRAFYLSESGFRYAAARIKHGADIKDDLHLHAPFSLAQNAGTFDLFLLPHYLTTTGLTSAGATTLNLETPGGYDSGSAEALAFPAGSVKKVRIVAEKVNYDEIHDYATAALTDVLDGTTGKHTAAVTFTGITPAISQALPGGASLLPVAEVDGNQTNVGGTIGLVFTDDSAAAFPKRNGTFRIEGKSILYRYTEKDDTNRTLKGIDSPLETSFTPFTVADGKNILLERFVRIKSVGAFQNASRTLTYHMPMAASEATGKVEETFDDSNNWEDSTMGDHSVASIGGDNALKVTDTDPGAAGAPKVSLIALNPSAAGLELIKARTNAGGFLSYDAQVKVGFHADPPPEHGGFDPSPIPKYFVAGLSFRLDRSDVDGNYYGLSFLRGDNSLASPYDNIPDPIVAQNGKLMLVLWQQTDLGATRNWLAYKDLSGEIFQEGVEDGLNGWTVSSTTGDLNNLWHITNGRYYGGSNSFWYGQDSSGDYNIGETRGSLVSPSISLCSAMKPVLRYASWHYTEGQYPGSPYNEDWHIYDLKTVELSTDDGATWPTEIDRVPYYSSNGWKIRTVDLSPYSGQTVRIRFRFDSVDAFSNHYEGWYIDNVAIEYPVHDATIALRLQEGPSVVFSAGSGTIPIHSDDLVSQAGGGIGTVFGPPIVTSGRWTDGDAAGTLILKNVSGAFVAGNPLQVSGSTTTAAVDAYRTRDNYIRVYLGSAGEECSGSTVATDQNRLGLPRGTFRWPSADAAEWPAENDYFTLIDWTAVNVDGADPSAPVALSESIIGQSYTAVIRSNSLPSTSGAVPEFGLHALGHGATNVYFDDFAVKIKIGPQDSGNRYAPVVQE